MWTGPSRFCYGVLLGALVVSNGWRLTWNIQLWGFLCVITWWESNEQRCSPPPPNIFNNLKGRWHSPLSKLWLVFLLIYDHTIYIFVLSLFVYSSFDISWMLCYNLLYLHLWLFKFRYIYSINLLCGFVSRVLFVCFLLLVKLSQQSPFPSRVGTTLPSWCSGMFWFWSVTAYLCFLKQHSDSNKVGLWLCDEQQSCVLTVKYVKFINLLLFKYYFWVPWFWRGGWSRIRIDVDITAEAIKILSILTFYMLVMQPVLSCLAVRKYIKCWCRKANECSITELVK